MVQASISQLKINPSVIVAASEDYPVAIGNRNKVKAYMIGKRLFDKLEMYIENMLDKKAVEETNFSVGSDFENVAKKLGI